MRRIIGDPVGRETLPIEYCEQAPTLVGHRANAYCRDGRHAMVLYSCNANPKPGAFDGAILDAEIIFEPAKEARPITDFWELGPGERAEDWHAYLLRFRQA